MAANPQPRPFTSFNFLVEITVEGVAERICEAEFAECEGLEMTLEPKTIREGGRNSGPVHMAGPVSYGQLTLKRGMTTNTDLWKWFELVALSGQAGIRANAEIVLKSSDHTTTQASFTLQGCMPVKLRAPGLNAAQGVVAMEEMQLVYESLTINMPGGQA
jgi:phage tail-like protein